MLLISKSEHMLNQTTSLVKTASVFKIMIFLSQFKGTAMPIV